MPVPPGLAVVGQTPVPTWAILALLAMAAVIVVLLLVLLARQYDRSTAGGAEGSGSTVPGIRVPAAIAPVRPEAAARSVSLTASVSDSTTGSASASPSSAPITREQDVVGVLRWLMSETEADAVAYLHLSPGGHEHLLVEPRGLAADALVALAHRAREAMVSMETEEHASTNAALVRWLGIGGSKIMLLDGASPIAAAEPLRLARFAIEWMSASPETGGAEVIERRVRGVRGVAWAELDPHDPLVLRVLVGADADLPAVRGNVEAVVEGSGVAVHWMASRAEPIDLPRIELVEVAVSMDGELSTDVRLRWRGLELKGRGHGHLTPAGRYGAGAQATVDALKPLVQEDITVESLYTAPLREGLELLVVCIAVLGQRFLGAVFTRPEEPDVTGVRAVLDALNRRLPRLAGRSGRI